MIQKIAIIILSTLALVSQALETNRITSNELSPVLEKALQLEDGNIIFQDLVSSPQSAFIKEATQSNITHVGILKKIRGKWYVVEAVGPVKETPLHLWLKQGGGNAEHLRLKDGLSKSQKKALFKELKTYYGKSYDFLFALDDDKIYCSELVYKAYKAIGIELGKLETIGSLKISSPLVQNVIRTRAENHPACKGKTFDSCKQDIYNQQLVSPASIYKDEALTKAPSIYLIHNKMK